jgi:hypothetical protein
METEMQASHTPFMATERIAGLRREADQQRLASHRDDREPRPQPQPWPRLLVALAVRVIVEPMRVELR